MTALKSMAYYGISVAIIKGSSLIMLPITTSFVDIASYGVLNLLSSFVSIAGLILTLGLGESLYRFASDKRSKRPADVYKWCYTVSLVGCFSLVFIAYLFNDYLISLFPLEVETYQFNWVLTTLLCSALATVPYAMWRYQGQVQKYFAFAVGVSLVQTVITLVLLNMGMGIDAVLLSGALSNAFFTGILLLVHRRLFSLQVLQKSVVKWQYSLSIMLASCISFVLQGSEQWIIASKLGATSLASYFIAAQLGVAVSIAVEPYKLWWFARRHKSVDNPDINNPLFSVLGVELTLISALVMMAVMPLLLTYIMPEAYLGAIEWLGWLCVVAVIKTHAEMLNLGCYVKLGGKSPLVINAIAAVCMLCLSLNLVQPLGLLGIIISVALSHSVRAILFIVVSQKLLPQAYSRFRLLTVGTSLLAGFIAYQTASFGAVVAITCLYGVSVLVAYKDLYLERLMRSIRRHQTQAVGKL
ncbi:oligosaccharide flippase family protein [Alteromonas sp. KUL49]|uniref:lipopolysaccharide biosynthesis protein n=1 Tax=Alteromonas sp. KUL49 TaxID=2480798 RepID=UPI00102F1C78|nr:oligosaccharide flippase family protein [Alteromonas sp. KUL49]TAP40771.1 lipopolysaccharide biosynthesis protein [Alteromonas sp. KUL49]GEA10940.1 sugar translocase [Alteromonas sp. KUL49]